MNRYIKMGLIGLPVILFIIINVYLFILNDSLFASEKPYDVLSIEKRDLKKEVETTGQIIPIETEDIYYEPYRGEIDEILVQEGDQVSAGTAIIQYQSTNIENQIAALEDEISELETEQRYYEDRVDLLGSQISEEKSKDEEEKDESAIYLLEQEKAEASYQADRAEDMIESKENEIDRLEAGQEDKTVESSVAGVVKMVNPNGASSQEPLVTIVSEDSVVARGFLDERDVLLIKEGEPVTVKARYDDNTEWTGSVVEIGTAVEKDGKKQFPVDVSLDANSEQKLPLGSTVKLEMNPVAVKGAVAVKDESIMHIDGEDYVLVVKKDYIDKRHVTFGFENDAYQQITKGLKAGETIVEHPNRLLVDDMEIETDPQKEKKKQKDSSNKEKNGGEDENPEPSTEIPDTN